MPITQDRILNLIAEYDELSTHADNLRYHMYRIISKAKNDPAFYDNSLAVVVDALDATIELYTKPRHVNVEVERRHFKHNKRRNERTRAKMQRLRDGIRADGGSDPRPQPPRQPPRQQRHKYDDANIPPGAVGTLADYQRILEAYTRGDFNANAIVEMDDLDIKSGTTLDIPLPAPDGEPTPDDEAPDDEPAADGES
jgi:hypothetical protein